MEKDILLEKQKRRMALRQEFLKKVSDPFRSGTGEGGTVFDSSVYRFQAMRVSHYEHFKRTPRSVRVGGFAVVLPILIYGYMLKNERDTRELQFRTGQVAYADRKFKFI